MQALLNKYREVHASSGAAPNVPSPEAAGTPRARWKDDIRRRLQRFFEASIASPHNITRYSHDSVKLESISEVAPGTLTSATSPSCTTVSGDLEAAHKAPDPTTEDRLGIAGLKPSDPNTFVEGRINGIQERNEPPGVFNSGGTGRLALLFIIIDSLPHECIWRSWLEAGGDIFSSLVDVYIHAKHPESIQSRWVKEHLVPFNLRPEWGSVELTKTMIRMLEHSLQNDSSGLTSKFCLLSESCIPIWPLEHTIQNAILQDPGSSWINYRYSANNGFSTQSQFDPLQEIFPPECVVKADQWLLLSRPHVVSLLSEVEALNAGEVWKAFGHIKASDEMYVPTLLALHRVVPVKGGAPNPAVQKRRVTFSDWTNEVRNPKSFSAIESTMLQAARDEGCLFMRKIVIKISPGDHGTDRFMDAQLDILRSWLVQVLQLSNEDQIGTILASNRAILIADKESAPALVKSSDNNGTMQRRVDRFYASDHDRFAARRSRSRSRDRYHHGERRFADRHRGGHHRSRYGDRWDELSDYRPLNRLDDRGGGRYSASPMDASARVFPPSTGHHEDTFRRRFERRSRSRSQYSSDGRVGKRARRYSRSRSRF